MVTAIQLAQRWRIGRRIGSGGFGRVFEAEGQDGEKAALKLIPKEPGADRELLFEDLAGVRNVVPIIDSGEWKEHWVLVMPRASQSLRSHLAERGVLTAEEAIAVLTDMTTALAALHGRVVHRDIKPENVLLIEGHWCLADFGIARYAEASTALDTRKYAWTGAYNAPERWRGSEPLRVPTSTPWESLRMNCCLVADPSTDPTSVSSISMMIRQRLQAVLSFLPASLRSVCSKRRMFDRRRQVCLHDLRSSCGRPRRPRHHCRLPIATMCSKSRSRMQQSLPSVQRQNDERRSSPRPRDCLR